MILMHILRNAVTAAALVFFGSLLPSAAFMNEVWHLEGYIASGNANDVGSLTRIHGTVKFTPDQIQFSTNIGNFTRQATMTEGEYTHTRKEDIIVTINLDPLIQETLAVVVEKTRAKITTLDESTYVLSYGRTSHPHEAKHYFKSHEWIGGVLTKHPVSSRLFPFDELSVELWLQPDFYEGSVVEFMEDGTHNTTSAPDITSTQFSDQMTFGGSTSEGFMVEWDDERAQMRPTSSLNELYEEFFDTNKILVDTKFTESHKYENFHTKDWKTYRLIHLGDGRIFFLAAHTTIGETITTNLSSGESFFHADPYIAGSGMECGVLEQKLWFESSFTPQAATMQSESIQASAEPVTNSYTVPTGGKVALVKISRGEVYEVLDGVERLLKLDDWVTKGSVIKTGEKSFVKLVFFDKSVLNMGSSSEMKVEEFSPEDRGIINLVKGSVRSQVTKDYLQIQDRKKSKLFIGTSNTVHGIRGTEFEVSYSEENGIGTTQLQMIEGTVEFTNLLTGVTSLVSNQELIVAQGPINGSGITGPEITVIGPTLQSLTSGVAAQSMGVTALPASSEPVVFRVRNIGQSELTGVIPEIRGVHAADFSIVKLPEETLSPITGESSLEIVFTPTAPGLRQAVLEIASSDPDESPFLVNLEGSAVSAYAGWSGGASFGADANGDGVGNGLAFLLGAADPNASALALLPKAARSNGNLVLTFSVLNSAYRNGASLSVEHSGNLGSSDPWAAALVPDTSNTVNGVIFSVTPGSPHNDVTATIPASEAVSGKLFGRLKAVE